MPDAAVESRSSAVSPGSAEPVEAAGAVEVTLEVPRILCDTTAGKREVKLEAATLEAALREIRSRWPLLGTHVFDESGAVRQHVLILHNGKLTKYLKSLDIPLRAGDRVQIVQAVSGG